MLAFSNNMSFDYFSVANTKCSASCGGWLFGCSYRLAGLLPATFLQIIARSLFPDPMLGYLLPVGLSATRRSPDGD